MFWGALHDVLSGLSHMKHAQPWFRSYRSLTCSGNGPTTVANGTRMQTLFESILFCVASNGLGLPLDAQLAA